MSRCDSVDTPAMSDNTAITHSGIVNTPNITITVRTQTSLNTAADS